MSAASSLSVIIISQNPGPRLEAALESVWSQRSVQSEVIVAERGSSDGTLAWLDEHRSRLTHLLIAPNAGWYEAMNAAVSAARGDWVLFFGARDRLVGDRVLSESLNWMKKTEAGVVAGEAAADDGRLRKLRSHANPIARNFVPRSAAFYRRTLFEEHDGFDATLAEMGDYDFNVRLWKARVRFKPIPLRIAACEAARRDHRTACMEEIRVRHRYFPAWRCLWWDARSVLRWIGARKGRTSSPSLEHRWAKTP